MKTYNALDLLLNNKRLDLISKYLYIKFNDKYKEHTKFFEEYYCAFIQAFNGFYENSDGEIKPKEGKFEFLKKFKQILKKMDMIIQNLSLRGRKKFPMAHIEYQFVRRLI